MKLLIVGSISNMDQSIGSGYDYGNLSTLIQNNSISGLYNYEQQAEIITDYYKMSKGQVPTYHKGELALLAAYKENLLS